MDAADTSAPRRPGRQGRLVLWLIALACVLPELGLEAADAGLWGSRNWRMAAYGWGGFWPGLFHGWIPNYPGQKWGMFATYGFLHAGFSHMAGNVLTLVALGLPIIARVGQGRFLVLYLLSQVGGGIGYALLARSAQPMVGASGALFGLAGAWAAWEGVDRMGAARRLWPVLRLVALLILLNVLLWVTMHGRLAWQTHLGGFLAGGAVALVMDRRPRLPEQPDA